MIKITASLEREDSDHGPLTTDMSFPFMDLYFEGHKFSGQLAILYLLFLLFAIMVLVKKIYSEVANSHNDG